MFERVFLDSDPQSASESSEEGCVTTTGEVKQKRKNKMKLFKRSMKTKNDKAYGRKIQLYSRDNPQNYTQNECGDSYLLNVESARVFVNQESAKSPTLLVRLHDLVCLLENLTQIKEELSQVLREEDKRLKRVAKKNGLGVAIGEEKSIVLEENKENNFCRGMSSRLVLFPGSSTEDAESLDASLRSGFSQLESAVVKAGGP